MIKTIDELNAAIKSNKRVVVKVSASWCGPCKVLAPIFEEAAKTSSAGFHVVDVDECDEDVVDVLNVRGVPVLIYYKDGIEYERTTGLTTKESIIANLEK